MEAQTVSSIQQHVMGIPMYNNNSLYLQQMCEQYEENCSKQNSNFLHSDMMLESPPDQTRC